MSDVSFPFKTTIMATGDSALGRGVHGAIPLHLVFEADNIEVRSGNPLKYKIALTVLGHGFTQMNTDKGVVLMNEEVKQNPITAEDLFCTENA
jgi:hypothetical protein